MATQKERYVEAKKLYADKQFAKAFPLMEALAKEGYADAQCLLGFCYKKGGLGVSQDNAKAAEWFRKAAGQGNAEAQKALNSLAGSSGETEKNAAADDARFIEARKLYAKSQFDKAFPLFQALAKADHAAAQYQLGDCYFFGNGVEENRAKGIEWIRKAAEQGHAEAQDSLARCYVHGDGVPRDETVAMEWWRKAAAQGHEVAREALNLCPKCGVALKDEGIQGDDRVYKCPKCDYGKWETVFFGPPRSFDDDSSSRGGDEF